MVAISQPIWIIVGLIGIADICLMGWCIILMRRARKTGVSPMSQDEAVFFNRQPLPSDSFQQNLFCLQIDAVFNGLVALVETERIKLKSLMRPIKSSMADEAPAFHHVTQDAGGGQDQWDNLDGQELGIDQQIIQFAAMGKNPAGIANQLGISISEVDLAMKLQASRRSQSGRKLEAVA